MKKNEVAIVSIGYDEGCPETYRGVEVSLGSASNMGLKVNTGIPCNDYHAAIEFANLHADVIMNSSSVDGFVMDGGSLERPDSDDQADGFSFLQYKNAITDAIMHRIDQIQSIHRDRFLVGLEILGIEMSSDYIEQSGILDQIEDERQRKLVKHYWKMVKQTSEERNKALDAIDAICRKPPSK